MPNKIAITKLKVGNEYRTLQKSNFILGNNLHNYRCHNNAFQDCITNDSTVYVKPVIYINAHYDTKKEWKSSNHIHFVNINKNGNYVDNTIGIQYKYFNYYDNYKLFKNKLYSKKDCNDLNPNLILGYYHFQQFLHLNNIDKIELNHPKKDNNREYIDFLINDGWIANLKEYKINLSSFLILFVGLSLICFDTILLKFTFSIPFRLILGLLLFSFSLICIFFTQRNLLDYSKNNILKKIFVKNLKNKIETINL